MKIRSWLLITSLRALFIIKNHSNYKRKYIGVNNMIKLSQLIFSIPTIILVPIICYLINWNKERLILAFLTLPALFFSYKILNYQYFESDQLFIAELIGLILSLLLPIAYLVYLNKKINK